MTEGNAWLKLLIELQGYDAGFETRNRRRTAGPGFYRRVVFVRQSALMAPSMRLFWRILTACRKLDLKPSPSERLRRTVRADSLLGVVHTEVHNSSGHVFMARSRFRQVSNPTVPTQ